MNKFKYLLYGFLGLVLAFSITFFSSTQREKPEASLKEPTLQSGGFLLTHTIYSLCNHNSTSNQTFPKELVGLTEKEVQKLQPDWEIIRFEPNLLEVKITLEALDEQCANRRYLGLSEGRVAIFRGMPGRGVLEKLTAIRADNLPTSEVESLKAGLEVSSEGEILEILEGLAEGEEYEELE